MRTCDKCGEPETAARPILECRISCWFCGPATQVTYDLHKECGAELWTAILPKLVNPESLLTKGVVR